MVTAFISDGHTFHFYKRPIRYQSPAVRAKYRWASPERRREFREAMRAVSDAEQEDVARKFVAEQLTSWDIQMDESHFAPVDVESLANIHPRIWDHLYAVIFGSGESDIDPEYRETDDNGQLLFHGAPMDKVMAAQEQWAKDNPGKPLPALKYIAENLREGNS